VNRYNESGCAEEIFLTADVGSVEGAAGNGKRKKEELEFERKRSLGCAGSPADGFANGRKRKAMKRRGAEAPKGFEVNRSAVSFVLGETVAGEIGVEAIEA
jgi:hypothetical protein